MKKLLVGAALAVSMLAAAPAANAATYLNLPSVAAPDGTISGTYGNNNVAAGAFNDVFNFVFPATGLGGATLTSVLSGLNTTNIDFTSVTFNGENFDIGMTGDIEFRFLKNLSVLTGPQTIIVNGTSGGNGSYSGTLSFSSAVPEPATWAMMIIGFTGAGVAIRRRRRDDSVAFA